MSSLYINPLTRDLDIDAAGNIAVATGAYALAQDAACAIKTRLGEVYYETTLGIDGILGESPSATLIKSKLVAAALSVDGVASAQVFITSWVNRVVTGQVQISDTAGAFATVGF